MRLPHTYLIIQILFLLQFTFLMGPLFICYRNSSQRKCWIWTGPRILNWRWAIFHGAPEIGTKSRVNILSSLRTLFAYIFKETRRENFGSRSSRTLYKIKQYLLKSLWTSIMCLPSLLNYSHPFQVLMSCHKTFCIVFISAEPLFSSGKTAARKSAW